MRNFILYIALALCVVLIVAIGMVSSRLLDLRAQVNALESDNALLQSKLEKIAALGEGSEVEALRTELETIRPKLAEAEEALATREGELPGAQADRAGTDQASEGEKEKSEPPFVRMFKDDETIVASAAMQVNMQYAMLLSDLKLPADVQEKVRDILTESLADQIRFAVKAAKDGTLEGPPSGENPEEARLEKLRSELSTVLNADEMAIWEEYEGNKQNLLLQQSYDMQLAAFAPSISQETRNIVKQVMAEEILSAHSEPADGGGSGVDAIVNRQSAAFEQSLERLSTQLTEDEYAQVERFLEQQIQQTRTSQQMMRSMWQTEKEGEKDE